MPEYGTAKYYFCQCKQTIKNMENTKHIIIPVGCNAPRCKESIMQQLPSSYAYEWMESEDFVREYLYCAKDGPYDTSVEVWLLVWDTLSNMVPKTHPNPKIKGCSNLEFQIMAIGTNLLWCKTHHSNIKRHLIYILPPRFDSKQYNLSIDQKFLGIDDIYILDMQEVLSKADDKMPLVDFLASMELKVAEVIAGKKP